MRAALRWGKWKLLTGKAGGKGLELKMIGKS